MSYVFTSKNQLQTAVDAWIQDEATALQTYGNISTWNVLNVTEMHFLFKNKTTFNSDISGWNTDNVKNMRDMFHGATAFNQDIGNWNTSSVTDMKYMFYKATNFNSDISGWNTTQVKKMNSMFEDAQNFNQDIGGWDTSSVTNMSGMFKGALAFNQDLSSWDISNVTTMNNMFKNASNFTNGGVSLSTWGPTSVGGTDNIGGVGNTTDMFVGTPLFTAGFAAGNTGLFLNNGVAGLLCFHKDTELLCYNQDTKEEYYKRCEDICVGDYLKTFGSENKYSKVKYHKITKANNLLNDPLNVMHQHKDHKDIVVTGKHGVIYLKSEVNDSPMWKKPLPEIKDIVVKRAYQDNNFTLFKDEEQSDVHVLCVEYENDDQSVGLFMKHGLASESCSERWIKTI